MHLSSCDNDPPTAFVPVLEQMHKSDITITDVLADSGYSSVYHRGRSRSARSGST